MSAEESKSNRSLSLGNLAQSPPHHLLKDWLLASGFEQSTAPGYGAEFSVKFRHPQMTLTAAQVMGRHFRPVVAVLGSYCAEDGNSFGQIEYEFPAKAESLAMTQAFLAHAIDGTGTPSFHPVPSILWLDEGRKNRDLLPWEREWAKQREAKAKLPRCSVARDWLRLGLKTLAERLSRHPDVSVVEFRFHGEQLWICGAGAPLLLPATGPGDWPEAIQISVRDLHRLPRRLMDDPVAILVQPYGLQVDRVSVPYTSSRSEHREESPLNSHG